MSNDDPERTAKYISALSNSAALCGRSFGYLVWGVDDSTHGVVGTDFSYRDAKKGGEELEAWLSRRVNPKIGFSFHEVDMGGDVRATVLEVPRASREPTRFGSAACVRVGSNLKPLVGYAELEARLWRSFDTTPDELKAVARGLTEDGSRGSSTTPPTTTASGSPSRPGARRRSKTSPSRSSWRKTTPAPGTSPPSVPS